MERIDPLQINREQFEKNKDSNVFVIMRYAEGTVLDEIEETIKSTLIEFNLNPILAKDVVFDSLLWSNLKFCMDHCRYSIVVFERIKPPDFSPNVSLELGYMLALKTPCLLLKDHTFPQLSTDILGHLYTAFDSYKPKQSISEAVTDWLTKLGHSPIKPAEIIEEETTLDSNKERTRRIIGYLEDVDAKKSNNIIRQAASLSSLAISDKEQCDHEVDDVYQQLLLSERNLLYELLDSEAELRIMVSPDTQKERVSLGLVSKEFGRTNIIPRYNRLIDCIEENINNSKLQIVYLHRLPYDNLVIVNSDVSLVGRKKLREKGFPYTTVIYDPVVIAEQVNDFDLTFEENAEILSGTATGKSREVAIKRKVIKRLKKSRSELVHILDQDDDQEI